jgi:hypothetical protein
MHAPVQGVLVYTILIVFVYVEMISIYRGRHADVLRYDEYSQTQIKGEAKGIRSRYDVLIPKIYYFLTCSKQFKKKKIDSIVSKLLKIVDL